MKLYDTGVKFYKKGDYKAADSCFSESIDLEPLIDTYFNRGISRKQLKNLKGYCEDLEIGVNFSDKQSMELFNCDCVTEDSFFVNSKFKKADSINYDFKLKFINYKYSDKKGFKQIDSKGKLILAYTRVEKDTIYYALPENELTSETYSIFMESLRKILRYPANELENGITGKVFASFLVNKQGEINEINVLRYPKGGSNLALETVRTLKEIKNFGVVKHLGKPVNIRFCMPINFIQN